MADGRTIKVSVDVVQGNTGGAKKAVSDLEREVAASQKRIEANTRKTDAAINASKRASTAAQVKENKIIANDFLRTMKEMEATAKGSATRVNSAFSSAFKGGFFGSLTGILTSQLAQLPSIFKSTLDEMVSIAAERQNAFKGLDSIATFKGISGKDATDAIKNLRLVKAGVVEITEASTGLKNLLATGFSLPQAVTLLERFSDSAAFGKQQALGFGEAIRSATEGLKNGNSILVDNAGVTKNLSNILEENGKAKTDVSKITSDASVREAVYAGLIKETAGQIGDADKLINTYTGSTAALTTAQNNLYAAVGDLIIANPRLNESTKILTEQIDGYTKGVGKAEGSTASFVNKAVDGYALLRVSVVSEVGAIAKTFAAVGTQVASSAYLILTGFTGLFEGVVKGLTYSAKETYNQLVALNNMLPTSVFGKLSPIENTFDMSWTKGMLEASRALSEETRRLHQEATALMAEGRNARSRIRAAGTGDDRSTNLGLLGDRFPGSRNVKPLPPGSGDAGGGTPGTGKRGGVGAANPEKQLSPQARAIMIGADKLGISPIDYATLMLYETAGTLNPWQKGPTTKWGTHRGTIQYGEPQAKAYGASATQSFFDQVTGSNVRYLIDRGVKAGATLLELYKAVNGGNVNVSANASDGYGTIRTHVTKMLRDYGPRARKMFEGFGGSNISDDVQRMLEGQSDALTKAEREKPLRALLELYKTARLIPSPELFEDFVKLMAEDSKQAGQLQMSAAQIAGIYGGGFQPGEVLGIDAITPRSTEAGEAAIELYRDLADEIFNLAEHTHLENVERSISLGLYKGLNPEMLEAIRNTAKLKDASAAKKKADEEGKDALEKYRDEQRRVFDDTENFFRNKIDAFMGGGLKGLWQSILYDFKTQFVDNAARMLANLFTGAGTRTGGQGGGIGGILGGLFGGGFGGGGIGPGGTAPFNPGSNFAPSGGGGGLFGGIRNLFGGLFGGGGSAGGGDFELGGIPTYGGARAVGAGGGILGKALGFLGGPWGGLAVMGGAMLLPKLFGLFKRDDAIKKLKQAATSQFGITVKDKDTLKALKAVGEGMFGKGKAGENAVAVVTSEEGRNILEAYADATGQSTNQLDRANYGDVNWSGNNFRSAPSNFAIQPRAAASYVPASGGGTMGAGGMSSRVMGGIMQSIDMLTEQIAQLRSEPEGVIVKRGLTQNPAAAADAYEFELANDGRRGERLTRLTGAYV